MIVVDSSALVAIYRDEPGYERFVAVMASTPSAVPASCYLESVMALSRWPGSRGWLDRLIARERMTLIALDETIARLAADAFARFGRGTGHPARLNFGDCLSYATARALGAPLLFKGEDFGHTDVAAAR